MRRLRECQIALMFLTRLPAGHVAGDVPTLTEARWAFPLVGVPLGLLGWAVFAGTLTFDATAMLAGLLALTVLALATGGLHHDGLADFADGMGGGRDRDHCLEIMRDSRIGSYGVLALILTIGIWTTALAQIGAASVGMFCAIAMLSRAAMLGVLIWTPSARGDGLGDMASGKADLSVAAIFASAAGTLILTGTTGVVLIIVAVVIALIIRRIAMRRIGGQTGDVLGATQLLTETACWVAIAL